MAKSTVKILKERYNTLYAKKQMWYPMYQLIGEYVLSRKQNFQTSSQPGEFLTEQLYNSTAPIANQTMASALIGNLWPNGARSVRLSRPRHVPSTKENKAYYDEITNILTDILDAPETAVMPALQEYMLDQGAFGISGIQVRKTGDLTDPLRVSAVNVKNFLIEENFDGEVATIFIDYELTGEQAYDKYEGKVSDKIAQAKKNGDITTKFKIVQYIQVRNKIPSGAKGNRALPIESVHFEFDTERFLKRSGYSNMPIIITRFLKALGETQGRSPAMFAMPAIMRLNVVWELIQRAGEKKLDPPLYLLDNGALGSDIIDTSPSALNVFNMLGVGERSPVGTLFDVGNLQDIYPVAESLTKDISQAFYIDRLMDLNNQQTKMTLGEAQIRDRIRGEGLSSVFKRQESECFSKFVTTCVNNLFEEGLLGVVKGSKQEKRLLESGLVPLYIPSDVLNAMDRGQKVYNIKYISPASRIMRTEEMQGLTQSMDIALGLSERMPEILDNYDPDALSKKVDDLSGVDEEIRRDDKTIQAIRDSRAEMQKQQMQVEQAQVAADVGMKMSQAQSMREGALSGRPRG